ncbi:MAG: NAD(P)-dependent oxidoreductase [Hyphomicrobiales bacterium]
MDVFFFEAFEEEEKALRKYLNNGVKAGYTWKTIQEYGADKVPAKIISTRTQSIIPEPWADDLDGIISRSTGFDHLIDYRSRVNKKISCGYLPLYCNRAVAEHAMMMWMNLLRKSKMQFRQFNQFHRDGITGFECEKKRLLVVGVGNIGYEVVKIGKGLGMRVDCIDLKVKYPEEYYVQIEQGIKKADIIVCAMNLNDTNNGYFDYDLLKKAPQGAIFINISRGEISPSEDLLRLLEEDHLGGVGLDVYENEKDLAVALREGKESQLSSSQAIIKMSKMDQVLLTPHNAFNTIESVDRKSIQSVEQVRHFLQHKRFIWSVPE